MMDAHQAITARCATHRCPMCDYSLARAHVTVLGQRSHPRYLAAVICSNCGIQILCMFMVTFADMSGTTQPVPVSPVSADDVLDVHNALKDWNGTLSELVTS